MPFSVVGRIYGEHTRVPLDRKVSLRQQEVRCHLGLERVDVSRQRRVTCSAPLWVKRGHACSNVSQAIEFGLFAQSCHRAHDIYTSGESYHGILASSRTPCSGGKLLQHSRR